MIPWGTLGDDGGDGGTVDGGGGGFSSLSLFSRCLRDVKNLVCGEGGLCILKL